MTAIDDILLPALLDAGAPQHALPKRYYSSLASLMHVLRDNAREMYDAWMRKFGIKEVARSNIYRVPPRPISGRWGRKTACENYVLGCDYTQIATVLEDVLTTRTVDLVYLIRRCAIS
jgi:hypothetical protein